MPNTTILITTNSRPEALRRLLNSLPKGYPYIIFDDSETDYGVSYARNRLIEQAVTDYVLIIEDDCIFLDTDIERLEKEIKGDILGLTILENGRELDYKGRFDTQDGIVRYLREKPLEFVPGIFFAKRESLLKYSFDESLKTGEHFAFFYEHKGKFKIDTCDFKIVHQHIGNEKYNKLRSRALDFVREYMKKKELKKRIDLHGDIVER